MRKSVAKSDQLLSRPWLSMDEKQNLAQQLHEDEKYKKGLHRADDDGMTLPHTSAHEVNEEKLDARIRRTKRVLEMNDPRNLSRVDRTKLERAYKLLENEIVKFGLAPVKNNDLFPSLDHMKSVEFDRAVTAAKRELSPRFTNLAQRWKKLGRILWPDDPEKSDLEVLRYKRA